MTQSPLLIFTFAWTLFNLKLCPAGWFTCQSGGITCIDKSFMCDCSSDCDDGSDETTGYAGCSAATIAMCAENSSSKF